MRRPVIVAFAVLASLLVVTATPAAAATQIELGRHTTASELGNATLTNMTVVGTGTSAAVRFRGPAFYDAFTDTATSGTQGSLAVAGETGGSALQVEAEIEPTVNDSIDSITVGIGFLRGNDYGTAVDVYLVQEGADGVYGEGQKVATWDPDWKLGEQTIHLTDRINVSANQRYTLEFVTQSASGGDNYISIDYADAPGFETASLSDRVGDIALEKEPASGIYESANYSTSAAPTSGWARLSVTNASATLTWEYYDNGWQAAGTRTVSSSGNYSEPLSGPDGTWRLRVDATDAAGDSTVQLHDEGLFGTTNSPAASNITPTDGTKLSTRNVTFEATVTDSDFGTVGDSVTAELYLNGPDDNSFSQVYQTTVGSNTTASTTQNLSIGGNHKYEWRATDSYGGVTTESGTISLPSELEIRDIKTGKLVKNSSDPINVKVEFYASDGAVITRNTTNGTVDLSGLPVDQRFSATVDAGSDYATRQVIIPSIVERDTAYLLPTDNVSTVQPRFVLEDPSQRFDEQRSEILIERPVTTNNTTRFVAVTGDRVGLQGFNPVLEKGQRYRIRVRDPTSGRERQLGAFTPTVTEQVTLEVTDVEFDSVSETDGLEWTARYVDDGGQDTIELILRDDEPTQSLEYEIYPRGEPNNTLVADTTTGNVTISEPVPPSQNDSVFVVAFNLTRGSGETISGQRQVSSDELPVGPPTLGQNWQTIIAMIILIGVAGLFGAANPGVGGIATAMTGGVFFVLGWLPDSTGGLMVVLAIFVSVLSYGARRARGATA